MNTIKSVYKIGNGPSSSHTVGPFHAARLFHARYPDADFIRCVAFGRAGEFADRYFTQGMRVAVSGRIQTGSYTNRDGIKVYTTEVVVEDQEFAQSKGENSSAPMAAPAESAPQAEDPGDGFMNIPEGIDEELPFN